MQSSGAVSSQTGVMGEEQCKPVSLVIIRQRAGVGQRQVGLPSLNEHIFEPFFTTRPEGTGLGLSTVYGIILRLGGHKSVDTRLARGTVSGIYFPALPSRACEEAGKARQPISAPFPT